MCYSLWSLICLFSHEDFDILLLVFHIPSLNSLQTYGKNMKVLQREFSFLFFVYCLIIYKLFFLVQRFNSHILCFLKWLSTHTNNSFHLNIDSLSIISYDKWTWMAQPHFFASDDFFPTSSSPPCVPLPLLLLLPLLLILLHFFFTESIG